MVARGDGLVISRFSLDEVEEERDLEADLDRGAADRVVAPARLAENGGGASAGGVQAWQWRGVLRLRWRNCGWAWAWAWVRPPIVGEWRWQEVECGSGLRCGSGFVAGGSRFCFVDVVLCALAHCSYLQFYHLFVYKYITISLHMYNYRYRKYIVIFALFVLDNPINFISSQNVYYDYNIWRVLEGKKVIRPRTRGHVALRSRYKGE